MKIRVIRLPAPDGNAESMEEIIDGSTIQNIQDENPGMGVYLNEKLVPTGPRTPVAYIKPGDEIMILTPVKCCWPGSLGRRR